MKQNLMRIMTLIFVVALVFVMACPAFASDTVILPPLPVDSNSIVFVERWDTGHYRALSCNEYYWSSSTLLKVENTSDRLVYDLVDGQWQIYETTGAVALSKSHLVYDSTGDILSSNLVAFAVCDGSTCPATDVNQDGVCDDCGLLLNLPPVTYTVSGVYQLKMPFTLEGFDFDVIFDTPIKLYSGDQTYTEYRSISKLDDNQFLRFYGNTDNGNSGVTGETYIGINSEIVTYIDFGSTPQEVSEDFYNWLGGNASFFRQVPSLTQVVSSSALEMVMTEVVAILPVGIAFLVGYLALRKALRVLQTVLFQA